MLLLEETDRGNFVGVVSPDRGFVGDERLEADLVVTEGGGGRVSANGEQDDNEGLRKRCRGGEVGAVVVG